jgi:hypothetical protein
MNYKYEKSKDISIIEEKISDAGMENGSRYIMEYL